MPVPIEPRHVRRIILEQSRRANVGHIGSCLCVTEILCALYVHVLRGDSTSNPDRDRFVLSKGHAALALYAVLNLKGWISTEQLNTFCGDDSLLGVHPEGTVNGIDFSAGSLGHGLGIAAGAALAARLQGSKRRAFCLMSDAELNEGSVWEAAMFAAHHGLRNLRAVIDVNGQQAMGCTRDIIDTSNLAERWEAFGWDLTEVDGHSIPKLASALDASSNRPKVVLARTVFGKGVSYMEQGLPLTRPGLPTQPINWHYLPMKDYEFEAAMRELSGQL